MVEVVRDLVEQSGASQRVLDGAAEVLALRPPGRLLAQDVGDVVEHAHRERVRLLEDHRHAPPQRRRLHRRDVHPVERDPAAEARPLGQLGEPVQRPQQRRLAAARRADQRQYLPLTDRQRDGVDRHLRPVGDRDVLDLHAVDREWPSVPPGAGRLRSRIRVQPIALGWWPLPLRGRRRWRRLQRPRWGPAAPGRSAGARAAACSAPSDLLRAAREDIDADVEDEHEHQQHERGRIRLVRLVAVAGRGVVVDVAGQRAAGPAQGRQQRRRAGALEVQGRARAGRR